MTTARKHLIPDGESGIYHCWSRCVRRAFLCGEDKYTGRCYDHRKEWVRERIRFLVKVFAIDVLAYALMSNHKHILLRRLLEQSRQWSEEEVARRWLLLYPKHRESDGSPTPPTDLEIQEIISSKKRVQELRERLSSISWFMKSLNEQIARRANREDECTGAFWEGRFKCKRIEDEAALLACSVYIDLNPVRAKLAPTPEKSDFTSVQERAQALKRGQSDGALWIAPIEKTKEQPRGYLSLSTEDYLNLLDITGRMVQKNKCGAIPQELPPILERLGICSIHGWLEITSSLGDAFSSTVGVPAALEARAEVLNKKWLKGIRLSRRVFTI
ncbi:MAG: hypothetical protein KDD70_17340 [Bdellovibrionales bacterium]|nr:hypothetical protein [Bdellovibrionales bacterium]